MHTPFKQKAYSSGLVNSLINHIYNIKYIFREKTDDLIILYFI